VKAAFFSIRELRARLKKTSQKIVAMEKGENRTTVLIMLEKEKTTIEEEIAAIEAKEKEQAEFEKRNDLFATCFENISGS